VNFIWLLCPTKRRLAMPFPAAFQGSASRRRGLQSDLATFRINAVILSIRPVILLPCSFLYCHRPAILPLPMAADRQLWSGCRPKKWRDDIRVKNSQAPEDFTDAYAK